VTVTCPKCATVHTLTGRAPGEPFTCTCGNVMVLPGAVKAAAPGPRRKVAGVVLGLAAAALAFGGLVVGVVVLPRVQRMRSEGLRAEAQTQLYTLCTNVAEPHGETGHWTAAGPQPKEVPSGAPVPFPQDADFEKLQFAPGPVRYQYQVIVEGNPEGDAKVRCVARGHVKGPGVSEATLEIDENGMLRPVKWRNPGG